MSEKSKAAAVPVVSNFIRNIIDSDLASGKYAARGWGGKPGSAKASLADAVKGLAKP